MTKWVIVRALLLTGARREEVAGMSWDEVAADLSVWTLPAADRGDAPSR